MRMRGAKSGKPYYFIGDARRFRRAARAPAPSRRGGSSSSGGFPLGEDDAVEGEAALALSEHGEGVDLDFLELASEVGDETREGGYAFGRGLAVGGRPAAPAVQHAADAGGRERGEGFVLADRCDAHGDVLVELDVDAARADHDQRAEVGIDARADEDLCDRG